MPERSASVSAVINDDLGAIDRSIRDVAFATAQLKAKLIVAALAANLRDGRRYSIRSDNLADSGAAPCETTLNTGRVGR